MDDEERRNAQAWIEYARKLDEEKQELIANVRWLMNVTHEVYHTASHYDAGTLAAAALDAGVRPSASERVSTFDCQHASCQHSTQILRAVAKPASS